MRKVHPKYQIPLPAPGLVSLILALIALLNIGSDVAFSALVPLPTIAILLFYMISIALLLIRKLRNEHPPYGPFKLRKWGVPINLFALLFLTYIMVWIPFPTMLPVSSRTMNYSGPITIAIILLALADWFTTGKKRFTVSVKHLSHDRHMELEETKDSNRPSTE